MASFKNILKEMWFKPPAGSPAGTPGKGFKHVFIGRHFIKCVELERSKPIGR